MLVRSLGALFHAGQYAQLEQRASEALQQSPGLGEVWKLLGLALRMQGKNAQGPLQRALDLLPNDPELYYNLGEVYRGQGSLGEAEDCFRRVLVIAPGVFGAYLNLGMIHQGQGRFAEAEADYLQAQKIKPDLPEVYYNLAHLYKQQGRFDQSVTRLRQAIELRPNFFEANNLLGLVYAATGRVVEAETAYRAALSTHPGFLGALINLRDLLSAQGRLAEVEAICRRVLEIRPDLLEVRLDLAANLYASGQLTEAESVYRDVLQQQADSAEALNGLAATLLRTGRHGESESCYQKALAIRPDFPELHLQKGRLLHALGRLDEALPHIAEYLKTKGPWPARLCRLTEPWVLLNGLLESSAGLPQPLTERAEPEAVTLVPVPMVSAGQARGATGRPLRVVLIYPPPWHIGPADDHRCGMPFGPPCEAADRELDRDFATIPYGLLTIAAEAMSAGHEVKVFNLSTTLWREVETLISQTAADVYGISAFTANRRGMGAVAKLIRQHYPKAHITAGGPFVTALPRETLRYYSDIDTAVVGEGEQTFMELLDCLGAGRPVTGIAGSAWRQGGRIYLGLPRQRIRNLDELASPFDYFSSHIVMTSRGCPGQCSFCGSITTWGKKLRFHSAEICLENFRKALARLPVPFITVKDDTFTAHRRRALAICDGIIASGMNFFWSCDTRADSLDEELLYKMRRAGCQRISLGVESGSPVILNTIHKDTAPEKVLEITRLARKYGIHVRYYMIIGNRGETPETVQQSIDLVRAGRPGYSMFYSLSFYPGTEEWDILQKTWGVKPDVFFTRDFKELGVANGRREEWSYLLSQVQCEIGRFGFEFSVEERQATVRLMPELHASYVDLANACFRAGRLAEAEQALDRAEALGFPIQALIDNQRACIALASGNGRGALAALDRALTRLDHPLIRTNRQNLLAWLSDGEARCEPAPLLNDESEAFCFQLADQSDIVSVGVQTVGTRAV